MENETDRDYHHMPPDAKTVKQPEGIETKEIGNTAQPYYMGIGAALSAMREGLRVQRAGWNGPGQYLELQVPDAHSKMTLPYIFIHTVQGDLVPWLASQTDILATDWRIVR
jgi:hypothetical protein